VPWGLIPPRPIASPTTRAGGSTSSHRATPSGIAERHGVTTRSLTRANAHTESRNLQPGARLAVPDPDAARPLTPAEAAGADLEVAALMTAAAWRHGWDPALVQAVAWVESRWDQHVVSDRGAIGVMQVQPATGDVIARRLGRPIDLHRAEDNVEAGVAYLALLRERHGDDLRALLAAYHQGPRAVRERGIYGVSHAYVDDILRAREIFSAGA
jgi:soluble lytic murein transglycosylase-like protein